MKKMVFRNGQAEYIYNEDFKDTIVDPKFKVEEIRRATHVEPDPLNPGEWYADLSPSGGPKVTGFKTRSEAIEYEIKFLNSKYLSIGEL